MSAEVCKKRSIFHTPLSTRRVERGVWNSERGSALLITMIVITVLGTIAFPIGASTISSLRRQSQIEDSQNAYQAAVSGLEDGLLRWRYSKNTETPIDRTGALKSNEGGKLDCEPPTALPNGEKYSRPTTSTNLYDRIDLSADPTKGERSVTYCIDPDKTPVPDPTHLVYDIKIQYRLAAGKSEVVESQTTSSGTIPALAKDEVVEYDVKDLIENGGKISQVLQTSNPSPSPTDIYEVIEFNDKGEVIQKRPYNFSDIFRMKLTPTDLRLSVNTAKIQMKYLGQNVKRYELKPTNAPVGLDSRTTNMEAIGYFGISKRKLALQLDRESGQILPRFDFVLFADQSGITSQ